MSKDVNWKFIKENNLKVKRVWKSLVSLMKIIKKVYYFFKVKLIIWKKIEDIM